MRARYFLIGKLQQRQIITVLKLKDDKHPQISKDSEVTEWIKIGFIHGNGNSNSPKKYEFMDENPPAGQLEYRLKQIDTDGCFEFYGTIAEINNSITGNKKTKVYPGSSDYHKNYPNPFNPSTNIDFEIPEDGYVEIALYDIKRTGTSEIA